jgi:hypothetical protein
MSIASGYHQDYVFARREINAYPIAGAKYSDPTGNQEIISKYLLLKHG